jgi:signal transduction histidine kinase/CheY-like chemotaxis protein
MGIEQGNSDTINHNRLPWWNWSIAKLLATEESTFVKAKIKIIFIFICFSILKTLMVLGYTNYFEQPFQFQRAAILLLFYILMLKLLLIDKRYLNGIAHTIILGGIFIVASTMLSVNNPINIITLQFVFMVILSSYYLLDKKFGVIYSTLVTLMVVMYLVLLYMGLVNIEAKFNTIDPELAIVLVVFNFITILIAHYLYHDAFQLNIAEKEILNKRLQEAVVLADKNANSKTVFLSTMSHELRTPLNSVIGLSEIMLKEIKDKEQKENLRVLRFSAENLLAIINDVLDFNRLGSENVQLEKVPVNLHQLVHNICSGAGYQAKSKGLKLTLKVDEGLQKFNVLTDSVRVTQILYNLISNAVKFTNEGEITVELKTKKLDEDHIDVEFIVTDTGIGIDRDRKEAIFSPFIQASSDTTRHYGGTGLGLSIVKQLLALFNSTIHVESELNKGSTFHFEINFKRANEADTKHAEIIGDERQLTGLKVLVAEDNALNILLIKKIAARWNLEIDIAENGLIVMEKLNKQNYDVILMDIQMPEMDGFETTKAIRSLADTTKSRIPIIALTANISSEIHEKIIEYGMNEFVNKPFASAELYYKLKKVTIDTKTK